MARRAIHRTVRICQPTLRQLRKVLALLLLVALVLYFIVGALAVTLSYVVMPNADRFRPRIETIASRALGTPVHIGHLSARWYRLSPEFTLTDLQIGTTGPDAHATPATAPEATSATAVTAVSAVSAAALPSPTPGAAGLSATSAAPSGVYIERISAGVAWRSLVHLQPLLTHLTVGNTVIDATRLADGKISVAGIVLGNGKQRNPYALPDWLLAQSAIVVQHFTVRWHDQLQNATPPLTLRNGRLALLNRGRLHRFGLQGDLICEGCRMSGGTPRVSAPADTGPGIPTATGQASGAPSGSSFITPIDIRVQFRHAALAALVPGRYGRGNPANWTGTAYIAANGLHLPTLSQYLPTEIVAQNGNADVQTWWQFSHNAVRQVSGHLHGNAVRLRVRQDLPPLRIPHLDTLFTASQADGDYRASVRNLSMELDDRSTLPDGTPLGRQLNVSRFDGEYRTPRIGRGERISLAGDVLDIGLLADFSRGMPLPLRLKRNVDRYNPRGVLSNYSLTWERDAPQTADAARAARIQGDVPLSHYALHAHLDGVTLSAMPAAPGVNAAGHPHIGQPGISNLRGSIDADQDGGTLKLDSHDAAITIRGMFDDPTLSFDTLTGTASWQIAQRESGPRIDARITQLHVVNADADASVNARFRASLHAAQDGYLDLSAHLDRASVPMVPRYLPTSIPAAIRQYLSHMAMTGTSQGATIEAHGRLPDLPYPHGPALFADGAAVSSGGSAPTIADTDEPSLNTDASTFKVSAPFTNATVDISPYPAKMLSNGAPEQWPAFTNVAGRFFMDGRTLGFDVDDAQYRRVHVQDVKGRIPDLADRSDPLRIDSRTQGPLADLLDFVDRSPLGFWSGRLAMPARADGNASIALRIDVARDVAHNAAPANDATASAASAPGGASHEGAVSAQGTLTFGHNSIWYGNAPPVSDVTGSVDFTTHSATSKGLRGRFLGGDVRGEGSMQPDGSLAIHVHGQAAPERIAGAGHDAATRGLNLASRDNHPIGSTSVPGAPALLHPAKASGRSAATPSPATPRAMSRVLSRNIAPASASSTGVPASGATGYAGLLQRFSGITPYQVDVNRKAHEAAQLLVRSDLVGLAIDLPAPLGKDAATPMPLSLRWQAADDARLAAEHRLPGPAALQQIDLTVGPIHAAYLRSGSTEGSNAGVIAGAIGLDALPPLPERGVRASLHAASFDFDPWRTVLAELNTRSDANDASTAGADTSAASTTSTTSTAAGTKATAKPGAQPHLPSDRQPGKQNNAGSVTANDAVHVAWMPDHIDVSVGDLTLFERHWHEVAIDARLTDPDDAPTWRGQLASKEVVGGFDAQTQGRGAIRARLATFTLPATIAAPPGKSALASAATPLTATPTTDPAARTANALGNLPSIDLVANHFSLADRPLGKLTLLAHNIERDRDVDWQVDNLRLENPSATFSATGNWRHGTAGDGVIQTDRAIVSGTAMKFKLAIHDGGALLTQFGLPTVLRGGKGTLDGTLNWHGAPGVPDLPSLNGQLSLDIARGQFLKVDPGAGRLLGLLSMQGLVRFLQLDFHSVFGQGLAFSNLSGTTSVENGVATTHDVVLQTTPARVEMSGQTHIEDESQDFFVTVIPHINAVSASIAAAIVNPVIGLGTLVAQLALSEPIAKSLTRYYRVQGHWDAPLVRRVDDNRGKIGPTSPDNTAATPVAIPVKP